MDENFLQSGEVLLEMTKTEYQNEFSRTTILDSKVGITLPIIATYFFLVLQYDSIKKLFDSEVDNASVLSALISISVPLLFTATLLFASISLLYFFRAISTRAYKTVDPNCFNNGKKLTQPKHVFSSVMVTYYIRALEHNRNVNDERAKLYTRGWTSAIISLGLFVLYVLNVK